MEEYVPCQRNCVEYGSTCYDSLCPFLYGECQMRRDETKLMGVLVDAVCHHAIELDRVEGRPIDKCTCSGH